MNRLFWRFEETITGSFDFDPFVTFYSSTKSDQPAWPAGRLAFLASFFVPGQRRKWGSGRSSRKNVHNFFTP
jgi:hypothetical protein